jgi:uncharacterized protein YceK
MHFKDSIVSWGRFSKSFFLYFGLIVLLLSGCHTVLVQDPVKPVPMDSAYCEGSQWRDDSSISMVPVPVIAFLFPHTDMYVIQPEEYLRQCAPSSQMVNREVMVSRDACIPAGLTRLITFGIWQWCPAYVVWIADIVHQDVTKD